MAGLELVTANELCLEQCHASIDVLQSVVEKLRLLPYPTASSREQYIQLASKSVSVNEAGRQCVVFGLAMIALRDALQSKSVSLSTKLRQAIKKSLSAITQLRDKTNRFLDTLLSASSHRTTSSDKYLQTFFKIMHKIEKLLDECSAKLDILSDMSRVISKAKLTQSVKQLASQLDGGLFSLQIEDIHERLERQAVEEARRKTESALTGTARQLATLSVKQPAETHGATVKRIMDPSFISDQIASHSGADSLAKQGKTVGPRTASTKREPFWKIDGSTPVKNSLSVGGDEEIVASPEARSDTAQPQSWPIPPRDTEQSSTSLIHAGEHLVSVTIDEVYDSYHDHAADATLGLPGSNAVTALRRQPSHKMRLNKRTMARTQSFTDLRRRARESKAQDKENSSNQEPGPKAMAKTGLRKASTMDSGSAMPLRDTSNRQVSPMAIDQIRDQYY